MTRTATRDDWLNQPLPEARKSLSLDLDTEATWEAFYQARCPILNPAD